MSITISITETFRGPSGLAELMTERPQHHAAKDQWGWEKMAENRWCVYPADELDGVCAFDSVIEAAKHIFEHQSAAAEDTEWARTWGDPVRLGRAFPPETPCPVYARCDLFGGVVESGELGSLEIYSAERRTLTVRFEDGRPGLTILFCYYGDRFDEGRSMLIEDVNCLRSAPRRTIGGEG